MKWLTLSILMLFSLSPEEGLLTAAKTAFDGGDYPNSIRYFRQASRDFPEKSPEIRYNIAQCYAQMDSTSLAMIYYEQVARTGPNQLAAQALNNMGEILARQQKNDQARKSFINALSRDPQNTKAQFNFELISRRMAHENPPENQPPSPNSPNQPPSPPDQETENYLNLIRMLGLNPSEPIPGDEKRPFPVDTISLNFAQMLLERMRQDKQPFVQQLTKRYRNPSAIRDQERPDW